MARNKRLYRVVATYKLNFSEGTYTITKDVQSFHAMENRVRRLLEGYGSGYYDEYSDKKKKPISVTVQVSEPVEFMTAPGKYVINKDGNLQNMGEVLV